MQDPANIALAIGAVVLLVLILALRNQRRRNRSKRSSLVINNATSLGWVARSRRWVSIKRWSERTLRARRRR